MIKDVIAKVVDHRDLSEDEMINAMTRIMNGEASDAQIGSFITALRMKGETIDEISGAAKVMKDKALHISAGTGPVVDTCGTGGDRSGTFNISTTAALIAAGAGVKIAKHGNRSVSSKSGSADVLKSLGVNIEAEVDKVEECLQEAGIGFLFAPLMHGAMKYAIGPRREMGIRTIFNILGPLTNPAGADCQVLGVFDGFLTEPLAYVLAKLGTKRAMVVHGTDGLDEITLTAETKISELINGNVKTYMFKPEECGIQRCTIDEIQGAGPEANAQITLDILNGVEGPKSDIALINAAAAISVSKDASDLDEGLARARESVKSGSAKKKLEQIVEITNR